MAKKDIDVEDLMNAMQQVERWLGMVREGLDTKKKQKMKVETSTLKGGGMTRRTC